MLKKFPAPIGMHLLGTAANPQESQFFDCIALSNLAEDLEAMGGWLKQS